MSLISDALRKARQDAAQREAAARGEPSPFVVSRRFRPRAVGSALMVGAVIGLAAAVAGGGAVWWAIGRGDRPPQPETSAAPDPRPAEPGGVPPSVVTTPVAERLGAAPPAPTVAAAAPRAAASAPGEAAAEPREDGRAAAGGQPARGRADPTPTAGSDRDRADRVFVLDADLGYARLSLGFIIDRADDPFAEINGQEVHVGSTVAGFLVEAIDRREVRLRDARGVLVLRAR